MIEPDESIIDAQSLAGWEAKAAADLAAGKKGQRVPKELRKDFELGDKTPVAARWRRGERKHDQTMQKKAAKDSRCS